MYRTPFSRIAFIGLAILMAAGAAQAQGIEFGPGGLRIDPGPERYVPRPRYDGISQREAVRIARRQGVEEVERVRETPRGWRISGFDRNGDEIRVIVSRDGDVIDVR
jgi:hypothetical protein